MTVDFISFCPDCYEPIRYVNSRPATHDCITDEEPNEENN